MMQYKDINIYLIFTTIICFAMIGCKTTNGTETKMSKHDLEIKHFQDELNKEYADETKSPLKEEDRKAFKGLDFFDIDPTFKITANFIRTPDEEPFPMETTKERTPIYVKYGEIHFKLRGDEFQLNVYQNPQMIKMEQYRNYLFLPFMDLTNGDSSYGGGRYLELSIPKGKKITVDFNKAYNPYCAYNDKYACPIPPRENSLDTEITAGVKTWKAYEVDK